MNDTEKEKIFSALKKLLKPYEKDLEPHSGIINSRADMNKPAYHLYGKQEISIIEGHKPQKTYFAGIIIQKHFIGLYFMPIYSHPKKFKIANPSVKRFLKGKSCFNVTKVDKEISQEIQSLLQIGYQLYKNEGWI